MSSKTFCDWCEEEIPGGYTHVDVFSRGGKRFILTASLHTGDGERFHCHSICRKCAAKALLGASE